MQRKKILLQSINKCIILICFLFSKIEGQEIVKILEGNSIPPYADPKTNTGASVEIITRSLILGSNHSIKKVEFDFVPLNRISIDIDIRDDIIGSARNFSENAKKENFTLHYIRYEDCVITKKDSHKYKNIEDLSTGNISAFQGASKTNGKKFETALEKNKNYHEMNNQQTQFLLLFKRKIDAIIADINIIKKMIELYNTENPNSTLKKEDIKCAIDINSPPYSAYFKDVKYVKIFNKGLKQLLKNKEYDSILKKYKLKNRIKHFTAKNQ